MNTLRIRTVGTSLAAVAAITYALCVVWDLLVPRFAMHPVWHGLFPGFTWSIGGVTLGLVEAVLYGFLGALLFVPIYNTLRRRTAVREGRTAHA